MIRVYVWGAGEYGKRAVRYMADINSCLSSPVFQILGVIDSDQHRWGELFFDYELAAPEIILKDTSEYYVVVAVKKSDDIIHWLEEQHCRDAVRSYEWLVLQEEPLRNVLKTVGDQISQGQELLFRITAKDRFFKLLDKGEKYEVVKGAIGFRHTIACMTGCFLNDLIRAEQFVDGKVTVSHQTSGSKNVALYFPYLWNGGAERVISELLKQYVNQDYSVFLFTNSGRVNHEEYEIPAGVHRCYLPEWQYGSFEWIMGFAELIERFEIDVVCSHATSSLENYYLGLLLQEMGVRFIITVHNRYEMYINFGPDINQLTRQFTYADELIVMSRDDREYWNSVGKTSRYIPNPVQKKDYIPCKEKKGDTILWIGRITGHVKNVFDTVDVMKYVKRKMPEARLKLVGKDADPKKRNLKRIKELIVEAGVEDVIEICGFSKNVDRYYQEADVMIMTSSVECFPMVIIEGKSFGLPLVLYDLSYLELLKDQKGYVSVPQRDAKAMADAVVDILKDNEKRERLSREARESLDSFLQIDLMYEWKKAFMGVE